MDAYTRGYRRACLHLIGLGLLPAPCKTEMQEMWANSADDRNIVRYIAENWEMAP